MAKSQTILEALVAIHERAEKADGTQTYIYRKGLFLSGTPYLWSGFHDRAFIFKNKQQAEKFLSDWPDELAGATVNQWQPWKVTAN